MARGILEIYEEARRRRVFQTTGVYVVAVWGLSQGAVELAPALGYSTSIVRWILLGAVVCLPIVVVLAWKFDVSREGIVRDPIDQPTLGASELGTLSTMPTAMGHDESAGAIVVRWSDASGGGAALFRDEFFIGRGAECRVRFYDPLVSRKHARVYPEDGIWMIEDLGSRNGTQLDARRIEKPMALAEAATLRVNEAGPSLRLEQVAAGPAFQAALVQIGDGSAVAHVRAPLREAERPRGPAPGRS
ncbi:MAG: FHA domain-containing protein [Myxococcota bacterium]